VALTDTTTNHNSATRNSIACLEGGYVSDRLVRLSGLIWTSRPSGRVCRLLQLAATSVASNQTCNLTVGPRLPTLALQQVGSYPAYTGRDVNIVGTAAHDHPSCFRPVRCRFHYGRTRRTRKCEAPMRRRLGPPPQALLPSTLSTRRKGRPPWPPVALL
jgi:hypothetical protein